jgi:uncharacterized membrane protein
VPREPSGRAVDVGQATAWLAAGWKSFTTAPAIWVGITLVLVVIFAVLSMVPLVGGLAEAFLAPVFMGGLMIGCHEQDSGEPLAFDALFAGFRRGTGALITVGALSFAGTLVIMLVVVMIGGGGAIAGAVLGGASGVGAGAAVAAGSLMLAGLASLVLMVPLLMALWLAPPLVVLGGLPAGAALRRSFFGCLKNLLPFFVYCVAATVLMFVALLPFGLGLLVLLPVLIVSTHAAYKDIFE